MSGAQKPADGTDQVGASASVKTAPSFCQWVRSVERAILIGSLAPVSSYGPPVE